jgi:hypothetical protein
LLLGVLFDFVCFFLVFFLTAIGAVYHRPIVPTAKTPMAAPLPTCLCSGEADLRYTNAAAQ